MLARDYPTAFSDAAHLLFRLTLGERLHPGKRATVPVAGLLHEKRAVTALRRRLTSGANIRRAEVLLVLKPDREDYYELLAAPAEQLVSRGHDVAVVALARNSAFTHSHNETLSSDELPQSAHGALQLMDWQDLGLASYPQAKRRYRTLRGSAARFSAAHELSGSAHRELQLTLSAYASDEAVMQLLLERTGAKLAVGIHAVLNPGILGALRSRRSAGYPVPWVLIQHGVFSGDWPEHDFFGADLLLTWGQYFSDELARYPGEAPPTRVVGRPGLELLLNKRRERRSTEAAGRGADRCTRVVFFGTNGPPQMTRSALALVSEALGEVEGVNVSYRPHPAEPIASYQQFVASGAINPQQLALSEPLEELLLNADLVLGTQTTLLPEAAAIGIPALQVETGQSQMRWGESGFPQATSVEDLRRQVIVFSQDPDGPKRLLARSSELTATMFAQVGNGAAHCATVIEELLEAPPQPGTSNQAVAASVPVWGSA